MSKDKCTICGRSTRPWQSIVAVEIVDYQAGVSGWEPAHADCEKYSALIGDMYGDRLSELETIAEIINGFGGLPPPVNMPLSAELRALWRGKRSAFWVRLWWAIAPERLANLWPRWR